MRFRLTGRGGSGNTPDRSFPCSLRIPFKANLSLSLNYHPDARRSVAAPLVPATRLRRDSVWISCSSFSVHFSVDNFM